MKQQHYSIMLHLSKLWFKIYRFKLELRWKRITSRTEISLNNFIVHNQICWLIGSDRHFIILEYFHKTTIHYYCSSKSIFLFKSLSHTRLCEIWINSSKYLFNFVLTIETKYDTCILTQQRYENRIDSIMILFVCYTCRKVYVTSRFWYIVHIINAH